MKQNINIFFMLGVIALVCGQLQGVTRMEVLRLENQIINELDKSPHKYQEVDFSAAHTTIENIIEANLREKDVKVREIFDKLAYRLENVIADAVIVNLLRLADPILRKISQIKEHIKQLKKTDNPFIFDDSQVKDPITNEINPRLDSVFQKGIFSNELIMYKSDQRGLKHATENTINIIGEITKLLENFTKYIDQLNTIMNEKKEKRTEKNFKATAQAIQTMKWVIDNLLTKLQKTLLDKDIMGTEKTINSYLISDNYDTMLSGLKAVLYRIYDVKQSSSGKISIKDYYWLFRGLYYSYPLDDPLKDISPSVAEIESKRNRERQPAVLPEKEVSATREVGMQSTGILAEAIVGPILEGIGAGMTVEEAVTSAIKAFIAVTAGWTLKNVVEATAVGRAVKAAIAERVARAAGEAGAAGEAAE